MSNTLSVSYESSSLFIQQFHVMMQEQEEEFSPDFGSNLDLFSSKMFPYYEKSLSEYTELAGVDVNFFASIRIDVEIVLCAISTIPVHSSFDLAKDIHFLVSIWTVLFSA